MIDRSRQSTRSQGRDRGSALIVGMVLLLLMTAISLTTLKAIKTDERMAGNLQDRYLAFQAAEAALREAEGILERPALPSFTGTPGLYRFGRDDVPTAFGLSSSNALRYEPALEGVAERPLYVIEQMEPGVEKGESLVIGVDYNREHRSTYRITSVGFGGSATTRVGLQTTFRR